MRKVCRNCGQDMEDLNRGCVECASFKSKLTDKEELKACPFCGGEAERETPLGCTFHHVVCITCGSRGPRTVNIVKCLSEWNRRAD